MKKGLHHIHFDRLVSQPISEVWEFLLSSQRSQPIHYKVSFNQLTVATMESSMYLWRVYSSITVNWLTSCLIVMHLCIMPYILISKKRFMLSFLYLPTFICIHTCFKFFLLVFNNAIRLLLRNTRVSKPFCDTSSLLHPFTPVFIYTENSITLRQRYRNINCSKRYVRAFFCF